MTHRAFASISVHFADLDDPRSRVHPLINVIAIGLCAVICGAEAFTDMEEFGKQKHKWLEKFLDLTNGIPSHDTFDAVFARLKPEQFEGCLLNWIASLQEISDERLYIIAPVPENFPGRKQWKDLRAIGFPQKFASRKLRPPIAIEIRDRRYLYRFRNHARQYTGT